MKKHTAKPGDIIKSKKSSRIWIDTGEVFLVKDIVTSQTTGDEGIAFHDRFNGVRVFWNSDDYQLMK
ncbi:hypothetical protein ANABIO32_02140 [Rossellomorea marisflavi]|uniref:hypothetical protein n=1 Tax=Rossellomorea marisflavi TaxID=189381 RepID=UPI0025C89BF4|nr:hypothetical protein [Rossellomorea marisflavi]GLI82527.1 hypothetical protein ANABIO32_02140 [Rossellomorea marisflavi]